MHLSLNFPTHKSFQLSIVFGAKKHFNFLEVLMRVIQLD